MINLKAYARIAWHGVELAEEELIKAAHFLESLLEKRDQVLELTEIGHGIPVSHGSVELTHSEVEQLKVFVAEMKEAPSEAPATPESSTPSEPPEPTV